MRWRSWAGALGVLALFAAASWLPGRLADRAPTVTTVAARIPTPTATAEVPTVPPPPDFGRAPLVPPRDVPAHAAGPVAAVRDYFFTLACAADAPAAMGPVGCGTAAYTRAYAYLSPGWQARLPFAKFTAMQVGVLHTDLLLAVDAGPVPRSPREHRVFAEVRRIQLVGDHQAVTYWSAVYTAVAERDGWTLLGGELRSEDLVGLAYATRDVWKADPRAVARVAAGLQPDAPVRVSLRTGAGPTATASLQPAATAPVWVVHLVHRVDGVWQVLYTTRG